MVGPVRTVILGGQVLRIVARLPPLKSLPADPEMVTGQSHVPSVGSIVIEPGQPLASRPAQFGRAPLPGPGAG